jgi:hypothetical protein
VLISPSCCEDYTEEALFALVREQETEHALIVLNPLRRVVAWRGAATTVDVHFNPLEMVRQSRSQIP